MVKKWRRSRVLLTCTAAFVLFLVPASFWYRSFLTNKKAGNSDGSAFSVDNLDFGEVWAQDTIDWSVGFTNHTDQDVEVLDFHTSCHCLRANPRSFVITPHGKVSVAFTLDLRHDPMQPVRELRRLSLLVVPVVRGEGIGDNKFSITGGVRNPLAFSVQEVFFGDDDYVPAQRKYITKTVSFESALPLRAVKAQVEPPYVTVCAVLRSETQGVLQFVPKPDLPVDRLDCMVRVVLESVNGQLYEIGRLPVSGLVARNLQIFPQSVCFRPARLGTDLETTVLLRSRCGDPLTTISMEPESKDTSAILVPCETANTYAYTVRHRISQVGAKKSGVLFAAASGAGALERVRLSLSYVGLP